MKIIWKCRLLVESKIVHAREVAQSTKLCAANRRRVAFMKAEANNFDLIVV
jgi:hypothetical protein